MEPVLLTIDPSVRNLGWCCVNLTRLTDADLYNIKSEVWSYGLVQMSSTKQIDPSIIKYRWNEAFTELKISLDVYENKPTHFASEWPTYFDSMRGRIAAQQNYTIGIASMVGYIAGRFKFKPEHVSLWTPMQWKGGVNKQVTKNRFIQTFGEPAEKISRMISDDVIDAIMISKYWLDLYHQSKFRWQHPEYERARIQRSVEQNSHS